MSTPSKTESSPSSHEEDDSHPQIASSESRKRASPASPEGSPTTLKHSRHDTSPTRSEKQDDKKSNLEQLEETITQQGETMSKEELRKLKNRKAAALSRARMNQKVKDLESLTTELQRKNSYLENLVHILTNRHVPGLPPVHQGSEEFARVTAAAAAAASTAMPTSRAVPPPTQNPSYENYPISSGARPPMPGLRQMGISTSTAPPRGPPMLYGSRMPSAYAGYVQHPSSGGPVRPAQPYYPMYSYRGQPPPAQSLPLPTPGSQGPNSKDRLAH